MHANVYVTARTQHTLNIHAACMRLALHMQMQHTCSTYATFNTHAAHPQYTVTCSVGAACMQHTCGIHAAHMQHLHAALSRSVHWHRYNIRLRVVGRMDARAQCFDCDRCQCRVPAQGTAVLRCGPGHQCVAPPPIQVGDSSTQLTGLHYPSHVQSTCRVNVPRQYV